MKAFGQATEDHIRELSTLYLTIEEVSLYLKIPEETIYKYVRNGRIPASKLGKHWRFRRSEIDTWVSSQQENRANTFRVLIVDDEDPVRRLLQRWVEQMGGRAVGAVHGQDALDILRADTAFNLVTLDLNMPVMDGVETLRHLRSLTPHLMVAIISGDFEGAQMDSALELGPVLAMKKPIQREAFVNMIHCLMACSRGVELAPT